MAMAALDVAGVAQSPGRRLRTILTTSRTGAHGRRIEVRTRIDTATDRTGPWTQCRNHVDLADRVRAVQQGQRLRCPDTAAGPRA